MPRPLRIEYPGAFYHIYARGNRKQRIFFSDEDRYYFLKVLNDAKDRYGIFIHVYCLMDNHYHLILETPEPNLSKVMHSINSSFAVYLNKKRELCGHLFQGRFQAILIQADSYARTLTIYIHGNPVRKKIVKQPEHYPWSSCQDYFGTRRAPSWLGTSFILGAFGNSPEVLRLEHERHLTAAQAPAFKRELEGASRIGIMGDDDFIDQIRRTYLREAMEHPDIELRELRRLRVRPKLLDIKSQIDGELGEKSKLARKCTIFLAHKYADYRLREIGDFIGISPAAVSLSYRRVAKEIPSNETLRRIIETVWSNLHRG